MVPSSRKCKNGQNNARPLRAWSVQRILHPGAINAKLRRRDRCACGGRNKLIHAELLHDKPRHAHADACAEDGKQTRQAGDQKDLPCFHAACKLLLAEAAVGVVALVLVEGFPRQLIALFGAANESVYYTDFAVKSFRIYLCMIVLACVNKACFIFLQAMGKAAESTALSMVREVVFGVGFALLLPRFFGLDGVLCSMPMSDILTFLIAGYLICKTYRELNGKGEL